MNIHLFHCKLSRTLTLTTICIYCIEKYDSRRAQIRVLNKDSVSRGQSDVLLTEIAAL